MITFKQVSVVFIYIQLLLNSMITTSKADELLELKKKTYFIPVNNKCIRLRLLPKAYIVAIRGDPNCIYSPPDSTVSTPPGYHPRTKRVSKYGQRVGNIFTFTRELPKVEWSGNVTLVGDSSYTKETVKVVQVSKDDKVFTVEIRVPVIRSPSTSPSSTPSSTQSAAPSTTPSKTPSISPSAMPSTLMSEMPSKAPSAPPSKIPSVTPTAMPSATPSKTASVAPSVAPSAMPSKPPSTTPSKTPSATPSAMPSATPSETASVAPSAAPSAMTSKAPSTTPSKTPSATPSAMPSATPSKTASVAPSAAPSGMPSKPPSTTPSKTLSAMPSVSKSPSAIPSATPTIEPFWVQVAQDIDGEQSNDRSGWSSSLSDDGRTVAIGAYYQNSRRGHVRVYTLNDAGSPGQQWLQLGQDIDGVRGGDSFGESVSLSSDGRTVAIGAPYSDIYGSNFGYVQVYTFKDTGSTEEWAQIGQVLVGERSSDVSGFSVSLSSDGGIVAIGAIYNDDNGSNSGHVRVYSLKKTSSTEEWTQVGLDIAGEHFYDLSGCSVSLSSDGRTVAIGAYGNDGNGSNSGHVRVYTFKEIAGGTGAWAQVGQDINGKRTYDQSGYSVSLSSDGRTVAIGAPWNDDNSSTSGHVRVYSLTDDDSFIEEWSQLGQDLSGERRLDYSGMSVSLSNDGRTVAIGAPSNDGNGSNSGHVRVFRFNDNSNSPGGQWIQFGQDINGERSYDWSGRSVNLSSDGKTVAIGAPHNDDNGVDSGHVRVFKIGF